MSEAGMCTEILVEVFVALLRVKKLLYAPDTEGIGGWVELDFLLELR